MIMKNLLTLALSAAIALSPAVCGGGSGDGGPEVPGGSAGENVQIPNPFADYDSLADAAAAAGFELTVPEEIGGSPRRTIQVMTTDPRMIQIFYGDEDSRLCVRKAAGGEDISGDYNVYPQVVTADVDGMSVTEKGRDDRVMVAVWSDGGYAYAVVSDAGMSAGDAAALIQSIK